MAADEGDMMEPVSTIGTGRPDDRTTGRPDDALRWIKASASGNNGGNCVELAVLPDGKIALRDSKNPDSPYLTFTKAELTAFADGIGKGEFDHLYRIQ